MSLLYLLQGQVSTMENRFLEMDLYLKQLSGTKARHHQAWSGNPSSMDARRGSKLADSQARPWAQPFSVQDRVLVILIENGGVDLGIPALVDKLLSEVPGASLIPDTYRTRLVEHIKETIKSYTDSLLETAELSNNRYTASEPEFFSNVTILRNGSSSYQALKERLCTLSRAGKIVDLFILTHGSDNYISVSGGIDAEKIRAMKIENGTALSIRSVYMMNCVGSSLNQAWLGAGAKVSCGALRNNYLPEPSMFFFWKNWKAGQSFETAVTTAYRQTISMLNETVRGFIRLLPIPGVDNVAERIDFAEMNFVKDSAPVIEGQGNLTIQSDNFSFA